MLRYTETKDWQKALHSVLPPRKGGVLKGTKAGNNSELKHDDTNDESDCSDGVKDDDVLHSDSSKCDNEKSEASLNSENSMEAEIELKTQACDNSDNDIESKLVEENDTEAKR